MIRDVQNWFLGRKFDHSELIDYQKLSLELNSPHIDIFKEGRVIANWSVGHGLVKLILHSSYDLRWFLGNYFSEIFNPQYKCIHSVYQNKSTGEEKHYIDLNWNGKRGTIEFLKNRQI